MVRRDINVFDKASLLRIRYFALGASGPLLTWGLYGKLGAILLILPVALLALASAWCSCGLFHMQRRAVWFSVLLAEALSLCLLMLLFSFEGPEAKMWFPAAAFFFVPYSLLTVGTVSAATYLWRKEKVRGSGEVSDL